MDFWNRSFAVDFQDGFSLTVCLSSPATCLGLLQAEYCLGREVERLTLQDEYGPLDLQDWLIGSTLLGFPRHGCGSFISLETLGLGLDDLTMTREGQNLVRHAGLPASHFLSPRNLAILLDLWPECAVQLVQQRLPVDVELHGFFLEDHHWIYFRCVSHVGLLHVHLYDGFRRRSSRDLAVVLRLLCAAWHLTGIVWTCHSPILQTFGFHCGTIALLNMGTCLGLWTLPTELDASRIHLDLLLHQQRIGLGSTDEEAVLQWLNTFLPSKGVPVDKALPRARSALKQLRLSPLKTAIAQKDPWKSLKQAGNVTGRPFQWVTYEELQNHFAAQAQDGPKTKGSKPSKPKGPRHDPVVALSPDTVTLYPNTFVDNHDDVVAPIDFHAVESHARGVSVVSVEQALDFQRITANLSTDALAVVSIGELPIMQGLTQRDLQWPALYLPTREPILVKGTLLQLGDIEVSLTKTADAPEVATIDTEVVRIAVFRDMFTKDWQKLLLGPVKHLLSLIPALQSCPDAGCDGSCRFFHAACDEDVTNPVLDVWSWRWTNLENRQVPVDQAVVFSVFLRIPQSALKQVLSISGWFGIFLERVPTRFMLSFGCHEPMI